MRGLATYFLAGVVAVVAMNVMIVPGDHGVLFGASTVTQPDAPVQWVDRTHKSDRLDIDTSIVHRQPRGKPRPATMTVGCEPAVSPLAAPARGDAAPVRCVA